jgi:hypothetical protein
MLLTGGKLKYWAKTLLSDSGFTSVDPYRTENAISCPQDINLILLQFQISCAFVIERDSRHPCCYVKV